MTRIGDSLLVQRVDDRIVMLDDSTGDEVVFPVDYAEFVVRALMYLTTNDLATAAAFTMPPIT